MGIDANAELYKNIKRRREELKMSQEELAKKVGYKGRSMIAKIESGQIDLYQSKIDELANALEVTTQYLMGFEKNYNDTRPKIDDTLFAGSRGLELNSRDKKDIAKDVISIMEKLEDAEDGPLRYNGEQIDDESLKLFRNAIELGLTQLKSENKVLYNPHKNDNKE